MRLNIGSGPNPMRGWTNVDLVPEGQIVEGYGEAARGVDINCDAKNLPLEDNSAEEIYTGHFLEHIPPQDTQTYLREMLRVLKPCGKLTVVVPDMRKIATAYLRGKMSLDRMFFYYALGFGATSGDPKPAGRVPPHQRAFDQDDLFQELLEAGFEGVSPHEILECPFAISREPTQCGFTAWKPEAIPCPTA